MPFIILFIISIIFSGCFDGYGKHKSDPSITEFTKVNFEQNITSNKINDIKCYKKDDGSFDAFYSPQRHYSEGDAMIHIFKTAEGTTVTFSEMYFSMPKSVLEQDIGLCINSIHDRKVVDASWTGKNNF